MTMQLSAHVGVAGYIKIEAVKRDGSRRVLADWFPNLITTGGLDRMGSGSYMTHCHVGSGSSTPAVGDSSLQTFVAATGADQSTSTAAEATEPYYGSITRRWRFTEGAAEGNLSEVGIAWGTDAAGPLFSRALIKDGVGDPTTITVLAGEFLDVTYQLRLYPQLTDWTGNVTDAGPAGTVHAITGRAYLVNDTARWAGNLGDAVGLVAVTDAFGASDQALTDLVTSRTFASSTTRENVAYVASTQEREATSSFGLSAGNVSGGISLLSFFTTLGSFQFGVDPPIPKTSSTTLTVRAKISWDRFTP